MKAMIFAAGMGTRLKPLTDTKPKALVKVGDQPLLARTIDTLIESGADEIVVNVHHFASQIISYLDEHSIACPVKISDESSELLDTGGGLKRALSLFSEQETPVLIHNVDILSNADLRDFYSRNKNNDATLLVSNRETSRYLLFDQDDFLVGWTNIRTGEVRSPYSDLDVASCKRYAFSGIHLFSPKLSTWMDVFPEKFPIMDFYLNVCDKVKIKADFRPNLRLLDVGKQDTLLAAESFLNNLK